MGDFFAPQDLPFYGSAPSQQYVLLNDEPLRGAQHASGEDALGMHATAGRLAALIGSSRSSTPFTVVVDAGWGTGKSSLMHLVAEALAEQPRTECVWFNAWTSHGADALEGLIKSVLLRFDRNVLRRALNRAREHHTALRMLRTSAAVALGLLHVGRIVDELWSRMEADAAKRNEIRRLIEDAAADWTGSGAGPGQRRLLVVFVDDLDRCPGPTVRAVCEAIKVYLDVPGLVFVLGYDQSRLATPESPGELPLSQDYLEKIVQISFRLPAPDLDRATALVQEYAMRSGTRHFFTTGLLRLVAERTGRNPRRIKRLINGLVMYQLDPRWSKVDPDAVIRTVLLQHLYPDFHRAASHPDGIDLIDDFAQFYEVWGMLRRRAVGPDDPRWDGLDTFADHRLLAKPQRDAPETWENYLELLEQQLPPAFPELASDPTFVRLITELNGLPKAEQVRELIRHGSPSQSLDPQPPQATGSPQSHGTFPPPMWSDVPWVTAGRPSPSPTPGPYGPDVYAPGGSAPGPQPSPLDTQRSRYDYPQQQGGTPQWHAQGQRSYPNSDQGQLRGLHVLWVDDKPETIASLVRELQHLGAEVSTARGTREALLLLEQASYGALISDTKREGDSAAGFRAVAEFRAAGYEGPVLFYTGQVSGLNRRYAEEAGALLITNSRGVLVASLYDVMQTRTGEPPAE